MAAVRRLPPQQQIAVSLFYVEQLSVTGDRGVDEVVGRRGEVPPARRTCRAARMDRGGMNDDLQSDAVDDELRRRFGDGSARRPRRRRRARLTCGRGCGRRRTRRRAAFSGAIAGRRPSWSCSRARARPAVGAPDRCARHPPVERSATHDAVHDRAAPTVTDRVDDTRHRRIGRRRPRRRLDDRRPPRRSPTRAQRAETPPADRHAPAPTDAVLHVGRRLDRRALRRQRRSHWCRAARAPATRADVHDNGPTPGRGPLLQRPDRVAHPGRRRERRSSSPEITQH